MGVVISHCEGPDGLRDLADEALAIVSRLEPSATRSRLEALADGMRQIALELPGEIDAAYTEGYRDAKAEVAYDAAADDDNDSKAIELLGNVREVLADIERINGVGTRTRERAQSLRLAIDRLTEEQKAAAS